MNRILFLFFLGVFAFFIFSTVNSPDFATFDKKISTYYMENTLSDTEAPNSVAAIVWDYRAYDTLGEETVLFTATLGIYALFRKYKVGVKK